MKSNFKKFTGKHDKSGKKGGLSVCKAVINILEKNFPDYDMIDVYLDKDNQLIKLVKGTTYKITKNRRYPKLRSFSGRVLITNGLIRGHYTYIGDGIFSKQLNTK